MLRSESQIFTLTTTPDVLDEAHRVWRRRHAAAGGKMRKDRETKFRESFDEILEDWQGGEDSNLSDIDDLHIHNAAQYFRVDILLTDNIKDFGDPDQLPYDLYTPDEFFCLVEAGSTHSVLEVTRKQNDYWQGRRDQGQTIKPMVKALQDAGCPKFAGFVEGHLRVLSGL